MMFAGGDSGPRLAFRSYGEDVWIDSRAHVVFPMTILIPRDRR
jgi:hypothetical protein